VPVYEYVCSNCGERTDILQSVNDPTPQFCPSCGAEGTLRKAFAPPMIVFKGSGWAKKDRSVARSKRPSEVASGSGDGAAGGSAATGEGNGAAAGDTAATRDTAATGSKPAERDTSGAPSTAGPSAPRKGGDRRSSRTGPSED
jgi:putative FmdB family regulatory protein